MAATDAELVHGALAGSERAFRDLVRRYQRRVFAVIVRIIRDPSRAEELAQDTFVKAFRALHTYDPRRGFSAWLLAIARHAAIDELRKAEPETVSIDDLGKAAGGAEGEIADPDPATPARLAERAALARALEMAVGRLRPEYRELVALKYEADLDYEEIAEMTGVPVGTIKSYLHRARKELAAHLTALGWGTPGQG